MSQCTRLIIQFACVFIELTQSFGHVIFIERLSRNTTIVSMSLEWISRFVVILVVAVVLSEAILHSNHHDMAAACKELQSGGRKILAMGERKALPDDEAHFYILTSGGHLYKLPLSNLVIDEQTKSLTVDQVYINASKLFGQPDSVFYLDTSKGYNRFFFISNKEGKGFLGRMIQNKDIKSTDIHLYPLSGGKETRAPVNNAQQDVQFLAGWRADCNEVFGYQVKSVDSGVSVAWKYTFKMNDASTIEPYGPHIGDNVNLKFAENVQIYNGFHIELGEYTYFFVLYNESVTISKISNNEALTGAEHLDKKKMKLSEFIVCAQSTRPPNETWQKPSTPTPSNGLILDLSLSYIIALIAVLAIVGLPLIYYCWICCAGGSKKIKKKKGNKKRKGGPTKDVGSSFSSGETASSGTSLNRSSSTYPNASTPESTIQNPYSRATRQVKSPRKPKSLVEKITKAVKSKVSDMLGENKKKAAKGASKANKSKKQDKSKVTKRSKIGNTKDAKPKNDGLKVSKPKSGKPKDSGPKDVGPKDVGPKDVAPKVDVPKDDKPKRGKPKDVGPKDVGPKDVAPKVDVPKDDKPKRGKPKDVGPKDVGPKDGGPKVDEPKDCKPKSGKPKDSGPKGGGQKA